MVAPKNFPKREIIVAVQPQEDIFSMFRVQNYCTRTVLVSMFRVQNYCTRTVLVLVCSDRESGLRRVVVHGGCALFFIF